MATVVKKKVWEEENANVVMKSSEINRNSGGLLMEVGRGTSVGGFQRWWAFDIKDRSRSKRSRAKNGGKADLGMACSSSLADHRGAEAWTPWGPTMSFRATADEGGGDLTTNNLGPKQSWAKFTIKKCLSGANATILTQIRIHTLYRTCNINSPLQEQHVGGGLGKWDYTL